MTFYGNAPLIKKTLFPRFLIPFVVVLQDMLHFVFSLPIVLAAVFLFDLHPSFGVLFGVPALLLVQFILSYSLNLAIASVNLFFRDVERLLQLAMTFLFYMTPVLYSETLIPDRFQNLIILHPIAPLIINWRSVLMSGTLDPALYLSSCVWALGLLVGSHLLYNRLQWRFAEVL
jgi:lipopolysaccharide transport system permease protein